MGFAYATRPCAGCGNLVSFNPERVPSVRMLLGKPDARGEPEPVCSACVYRINERRIGAGMDPIMIPPGAYGPMEAGS